MNNSTFAAAAGNDGSTTGVVVDVEIDGSKGEGGGQILRNAVAYSGLTKQSVRIRNIRAARSRPGLMAQHASGIQLIRDICGGELRGNNIGSTEVTYHPEKQPKQSERSQDDVAVEHNQQQRKRKAAPLSCSSGEETTIVSDTKTAGSICLLLQAALPCALLLGGKPTQFQKAKSTIQKPINLLLRGGTNASMAPQYDYWEKVFLPVLRKQFRVPVSAIKPFVERRGFYPKGGGEVRVKVGGSPNEAISLPLSPIDSTEQGRIVRIEIRSFHAGKLPRYVAVDMAKSCKEFLMKKYSKDTNTIGTNTTTTAFVASPKIVESMVHVNIVTETKAVGNGLGILVVAETSTGCILAGSQLSSPPKKWKNQGGEKVNGRELGIEAARELCDAIDTGACVDDWLQDQVIIFMALSKGLSRIVTGSLTLHTRTAIWVAEQFTEAKFRVVNLQSQGDDKNNEMGPAVAGKDSINNYGKGGRIPGKHLIECQGIGFT